MILGGFCLGFFDQRMASASHVADFPGCSYASAIALIARHHHYRLNSGISYRIADC